MADQHFDDLSLLINQEGGADFHHTHALLVTGKRKRLYVNLAAAERAVLRARARGEVSDLVLMCVTPAEKVDAR